MTPAFSFLWLREIHQIKRKVEKVTEIELIQSSYSILKTTSLRKIAAPYQVGTAEKNQHTVQFSLMGIRTQGLLAPELGNRQPEATPQNIFESVSPLNLICFMLSLT